MYIPVIFFIRYRNRKQWPYIAQKNLYKNQCKIYHIVLILWSLLLRSNTCLNVLLLCFISMSSGAENSSDTSAVWIRTLWHHLYFFELVPCFCLADFYVFYFWILVYQLIAVWGHIYYSLHKKRKTRMWIFGKHKEQSNSIIRVLHLTLK